MQDRISAAGQDGYVKLTEIDATNGIYKLERADNPTQAGTPLNKETLLSDDAVAAVATATNETVDTPSEAIQALAGNTQTVRPLSAGGTGKNFQSMPNIRVNLGSDASADLFQENVRPGVYGTISPAHLPIAGSVSSQRGAVYAGSGLDVTSNGGIYPKSSGMTFDHNEDNPKQVARIGNLVFVWLIPQLVTRFLEINIPNNGASIACHGIWYNPGYQSNYFGGDVSIYSQTGASFKLEIGDMIRGAYTSIIAPIVVRLL